MNGDPWFLINALRTIFSALDNFGYFILDAVYDIFFTVANSNVFQGTVINTFYSRVQLILGVFMIFKLSITLLQMIVNPDMYKDKQKGAGSLVKRIAIILVLLTLIVPITLDEGAIDGNPLNEQIASNGLSYLIAYSITISSRQYQVSPPGKIKPSQFFRILFKSLIFSSQQIFLQEIKSLSVGNINKGIPPNLVTASLTSSTHIILDSPLYNLPTIPIIGLINTTSK